MRNTSELRRQNEATALRVFAGNGFGDAAIGITEQQVLSSSVELEQLARAHRSDVLGQLLRTAIHSVGGFARRVIEEWKHRQYARATYEALRGLDARVLRDLGFHRSELMSIAAEVADMTDSTRTHLVPIRHGRRS
jgi:hypothetical protein